MSSPVSSFSDDLPCTVDAGDIDFIDAVESRLLLDPSLGDARPRCCVRHAAKIDEDGVEEEESLHGGTQTDGMLVLSTEFMYGDGTPADVKLAGSWNDWIPVQMKMVKKSYSGNTWWRVVTPVKYGKHEFKFIIDGQWKKSEKHPSKHGNNVRDVTNVAITFPVVVPKSAVKACCVIV